MQRIISVIVGILIISFFGLFVAKNYCGSGTPPFEIPLEIDMAVVCKTSATVSKPSVMLLDYINKWL